MPSCQDQMEMAYKASNRNHHEFQSTCTGTNANQGIQRAHSKIDHSASLAYTDQTVALPIHGIGSTVVVVLPGIASQEDGRLLVQDTVLVVQTVKVDSSFTITKHFGYLQHCLSTNALAVQEAIALAHH